VKQLEIKLMTKKHIKEYDAVIIGGGISGCEASYISAAKGARTLLISISTDSIGYMAFENYISNTKGMAAAGENIWNGLIIKKAAQKSTIGFNNIMSIRKDNSNNMTIVDRKRQMIKLKEIIENHKNVETRQALVIDLIPTGSIYHVVTNDGTIYKSKIIILATGTFLDSIIFWGSYNIAAGRPGEIASKRFLKNLIKIGFKFIEAKVYSGPRIDGRTLDINKYIKNKESHKLSIIPEGKETNEFYVDGFKTANSEEEQLKTLREIKGLENIIMTRPGYGIKYNVLSPLQIKKNLESKKFPGMFFCGRVNGLSEYEATAAQGYIAGLNAFKKIIK